MNKITISALFCKGCEYCVKFCPKGVLEMSDQRGSKGYFNPYVTDAENCITCLMCTTVCPEGAIAIARGGEEQ
jgi:2-oxoglutarate ferredoxin oxidoreductase subunit delta